MICHPESCKPQYQHKLMWWEHDEAVCIHKNGEYHIWVMGLEKAKEYVSGKIAVEHISDIYRSPQTGCYIMDIKGGRR